MADVADDMFLPRLALAAMVIAVCAWAGVYVLASPRDKRLSGVIGAVCVAAVGTPWLALPMVVRMPSCVGAPALAGLLAAALGAKLGWDAARYPAGPTSRLYRPMTLVVAVALSVPLAALSMVFLAFLCM